MKINDIKINSSVRLSSEAWLLRSPEWLITGVGSVPGELKLADGRLSFTAFGRGNLGRRQLNKLEGDAHQPGLADRMNGGENSVVFELPITEVEVEFPWHYFECGLRVRVENVLQPGMKKPVRRHGSWFEYVDEALGDGYVGGVQYRFCFGDPYNVVHPGPQSADLSGVLESFKGALENFQEGGKRRCLGKAWKNALSEIGLSGAVYHTGS
jgi:hypothetical protein